MDIVRRYMHYLTMSDLRINAAARFVCEPDWTWDTYRALWEDNDLWLVLSGVGELQTPEDRYELARGDCFLLRGGRRYRAKHEPTAPLTVIAVHFDLLKDGAPQRPATSLAGEHRRVWDPEFLAQCLERLLEEYRDPTRGNRGREHATLWLRAALGEIRRIDRAVDLTTHSTAPESRVRAICDYLRTHPTERHTIDSLAHRCTLSTTHFIRLFRRVTGATPGRYMIRNRVEAAKSLLRDSDHPVKRIADILGYEDQFFFSRQFHKEVGFSPADFRKRSTG